MLSFIKHHLTTMDGVAIYPVISLLIFVLFFIALGVHTAMMRKESIDHLGHLPLEDGRPDKSTPSC